MLNQRHAQDAQQQNHLSERAQMSKVPNSICADEPSNEIATWHKQEKNEINNRQTYVEEINQQHQQNE